MGFFRRAPEDPEQAAARERIEAGGIPRAAEERLNALGRESGLFTSGLSVGEFALLRRLGPRPLAQVMGASVVRPGWQLLPALPPSINVNTASWYGGSSPSPGAALNRFADASASQLRQYTWRTEVVCELDTLSDAWNLARRRALDRLAEEALQVGADAVTGVHLTRSDHALGGDLIEYAVSGTAIRHPESRGDGWPLLTDVSVQDLWRLREVGYDAVGLLAASIVVFASPARSTRLQRRRAPRQNFELEELSKAFHAARDTLRARLRGQVEDAHATGAVGVAFAHTIRREKFSLASSLGTADRRGWHRGRGGLPYYVSGRGDAERPGWMITMHAAGTAIRPHSGRTVTGMTEVKATLPMGAR